MQEEDGRTEEELGGGWMFNCGDTNDGGEKRGVLSGGPLTPDGVPTLMLRNVREFRTLAFPLGGVGQSQMWDESID